MKIGRVAGTVVSTISAPIFNGRKLLLCDIVTPQGEPTGDYTIAADTIDAGVGDTVLILDEGSSARQIVGQTVAPIRAMVVGIVDEIDIG
ncbi:MAG: EutN/CcmL family microcompartment protein [Acidimicrobiia bacterium]|nr:EutN/CcmL family microcompartment protein [Acidimicrobiia bacterium]